MENSTKQLLFQCRIDDSEREILEKASELFSLDSRSSAFRLAIKLLQFHINAHEDGKDIALIDKDPNQISVIPGVTVQRIPSKKG